MPMIPLTDIRIDGGTQARVEIKLEVVHEYSEHLKDGDKFPPVVVFKDNDENLWLADGFHRYHAHKHNGLLEIETTIKYGSLDDAVLYAFGANGKRGLSMTFEDNRNVIKRMLEHPKWSKWSNAEIARHVGVSKMTVGRVRKLFEGDKPEAPEPKKRKYVDKHGKESEINTKNLGKKAEPDKQPSSDQDRIDELVAVVAELSEENEMLKDKIAVGQWDATDIEKLDIQETVTELRNQVKALETENKALRDSRNMYQNRNAELMRTVKSLQNKLKKYEH